MSTAAIREIPGITSPITHAGRVVYNARRDFLETRRRQHRRGLEKVYKQEDFGEAEDHSIQPYELCFRWNEPLNKIHSPNDTDMCVFSSANGIALSTLDTNNLNQGIGRGAQLVDLLMNSVHFAGVACNRALYDPNNNANEEGFAVQVGGLQTIYNTGAADIFAGDLVVWGKPAANRKNDPGLLDRPRIPGIRHEKALFTVNRWDFNAPGGFNFQKAQRIIGKAMSTARMGQPFDIMLGRYCV